MKTAFYAAIVLIVAGLLAGGALALDTNSFQSVSGDYGRNVLSSIGASASQETAENKNKTLWDWGGSPKGTMVLDGNLIADPRYALKNLSVSQNWLGDSLVDPYGETPAYTYTDPTTGEPVRTYVDPLTGQSYYTYTDSSTGKLVYVYFNPQTGEPTYASFAPISGQQIEKEQYVLPPIFRSN